MFNSTFHVNLLFITHGTLYKPTLMVYNENLLGLKFAMGKPGHKNSLRNMDNTNKEKWKGKKQLIRGCGDEQKKLNKQIW